MIEDMTVTEILTLRENLLSETSNFVSEIILNEIKQRQSNKNMNFLVLDLSLFNRPQYISKADDFLSYEDPSCDYNWNSEIHKPISWHAYAACMNGRFICASPTNNWAEHVKWADTILVLWNYDPSIARDIILKIKKLGKKVIGGFHENGDFFQHNAKHVQWVVDFKNCANACDAILTYPRNKISRQLFEAMGITSEMLYIIQPYHTDKMKEFSLPADQKEGIFVGPIKKDSEIERRNWLYNVLLAGKLVKEQPEIYGKIVSTINNSQVYTNEQLHHLLEEINPAVQWNVVGMKPYHEYLLFIAQHRYTVNADSSDTQGQVDADSLFVGNRLIDLDLGYQTDFADAYHKFDDMLTEYHKHDLGYIFSDEENAGTSGQFFMLKEASMQVAKQRIETWFNNKK